VFPGRDHFGRIFLQSANMSAQGSPQIAAVWDPAPRAAPMWPDVRETVIVLNQARFSAGPPLVKRLRRGVSAEDLRGRRCAQPHLGVTDHYAENVLTALASPAASSRV